MFLTEREHDICDRIQASGKIPVPEFTRVSGDILCSQCGRSYYDHPNAIPFTWLRITCEGKYVKL